MIKVWHTTPNGKVGGIHEHHVGSWVLKNPAFNNYIFSDDMLESFIFQNFDKKTYEFFVSLPLGIMKADFWRIAVLYINGGIYADTDVMCNKEIFELIESHDLIFLEEFRISNNIANFFIYSKFPKNPILKKILDKMMTDYYDIFTHANQKWFVQNFGMNTVHHIVRNEKEVYISPYSEYSKYMVHQCKGTWRNMTEEYFNGSDITFVTTFNDSGYNLYGKKWIESFVTNAASQSKNIKAVVYYQDTNIEEFKDTPSIEFIDFNEVFPNHIEWIQKFNSSSGHNKAIKASSIRFSHKAKVIAHAMQRANSEYLIWLDADCVMHEADYRNFPENVLDEEFLACQLENVKEGHHHIESGILIFNLKHENRSQFSKELFDYYESFKLTNLSEPYDGFVIYRVLYENDISFIDLNENSSTNGIQSCPTKTFLNEKIKDMFTHNIGITGKKAYSDSEYDIRRMIYDPINYLEHCSPKYKKLAHLRKLQRNGARK